MQGYPRAEGEERKRRRPNWADSTLGVNTVASDSTTSFGTVCQYGHENTVGNSALFKPLQRQDSPAFIDIIIRDHLNACFEQRQEEVNQQPDKTRLEMDAAVESVGHPSSKPLNGLTPTSKPPIKKKPRSLVKRWRKRVDAEMKINEVWPFRGGSIGAVGLSYFRDGRKISVGDCALFKPPQESPPFIGIIRWFTSGKEDNLKLGVNWLYRPAEVKLGKGILLEAAPEEVFYSFHKDEIPVASLLHTCKVAFLRKGVELPSGIASFVCRRVYDIANKCLWWLTDQDYINERQEEVDHLLNKTRRLEMQAAVQSGGRSPKPLNGPTPTSTPPIKNILESEIAKITEKGGLVDFDGVEKFVQLIQPDRTEKKIDMAGRIMLADVIASTYRFDCLDRFVQLRGLNVLDEWLLEVHKGKIGDGGSPKEGDKSSEEFFLALLRALDKLPVSFHVLQICNVGKSVNQLCSHKNLEIQNKARSLVGTWKKRVEAEMKTNAAKFWSGHSVSRGCKQSFSEVSPEESCNTGGSSSHAVSGSLQDSN